MLFVACPVPLDLFAVVHFRSRLFLSRIDERFHNDSIWLSPQSKHAPLSPLSKANIVTKQALFLLELMYVNLKMVCEF